MQTHENKDDHRIKYAIPAFYMNEMAYCFTTMSIAVTSIKAMIVCKETKKILDERKQVSPYYIQTAVRLYYNKEVNHNHSIYDVPKLRSQDWIRTILASEFVCLHFDRPKSTQPNPLFMSS